MWVGSIHEAICIPANSAKVLQGKMEKITHCLTCMVEARAVNNLPMGLVVNRTMVTPNKSKKVPVVIVNMNSYNVWIHQPLLAADIVEVEICPKTLQGSLVANQPLELLCIDFTKADIMKGGKENILVLTDAFSKYSQAFVSNNQKSLTVAKYLWKNGSLFLGYLPGSIVIKVSPLIMRSFQIPARCMALGRALPRHTICAVIVGGYSMGIGVLPSVQLLSHD